MSLFVPFGDSKSVKEGRKRRPATQKKGLNMTITKTPSSIPTATLSLGGTFIIFLLQP